MPLTYEEANLGSVIYNGEVYYQVLRPIPAGTFVMRDNFLLGVCIKFLERLFILDDSDDNLIFKMHLNSPCVCCRYIYLIVL